MANLNLNVAILGGRLTADPELKMTGSGIAATTFNVAVERPRMKDANGQLKESVTDFIRCTAWRKTAEFITRYFHKGSNICIEGSIQTGSYEKNGQTHFTTDILVSSAHFVDSRSERTESTQSDVQGLDGISSPPTAFAPQNATAPHFEPINTDEGDLPF